MRVPLLALLPIALGTFASLANARFTDDVDAREIHARSFHDDLALDQRDILATISTRELIDALSEQLERRERDLWWCSKCKAYFYSVNQRDAHKRRVPDHDITKVGGQ
ncbi:hypothetical protein DFP72DRAFT_1081652 [Ephemerocybe angulata]|uniref:C2H2-type domain-containing protein n=1 Tax=Ephemerocybe angulata TaxID=980116 RepID=A0A8H6HAM2_9AGAR|nr:hypothetical protein DFP72DRAFT_1081652 [Tulosesus angulatus]